MRVQNINATNSVKQNKSNNEPNFGIKIHLPKNVIDDFYKEVAQYKQTILSAKMADEFASNADAFILDFAESIAVHNANPMNHVPYDGDAFISKVKVRPTPNGNANIELLSNQLFNKFHIADIFGDNLHPFAKTDATPKFIENFHRYLILSLGTDGRKEIVFNRIG